MGHIFMNLSAISPKHMTTLYFEEFSKALKTTASAHGANFSTTTPRDFERIKCIVWTFVMWRAVIHVFGAEHSPVRHAPFRHHHYFLLEPFLVDNDPNIFAAAVGQGEMPYENRCVSDALRAMILTFAMKDADRETHLNEQQSHADFVQHQMEKSKMLTTAAAAQQPQSRK
jgi:hypothetical protein